MIDSYSYCLIVYTVIVIIAVATDNFSRIQTEIPVELIEV